MFAGFHFNLVPVAIFGLSPGLNPLPLRNIPSDDRVRRRLGSHDGGKVNPHIISTGMLNTAYTVKTHVALRSMCTKESTRVGSLIQSTGKDRGRHWLNMFGYSTCYIIRGYGFLGRSLEVPITTAMRLLS